MVVDQNTDLTFDVLKGILDSRPGLADQVKTAQVGPDIRNSLPDTAFADTGNRLFPVNTPEAALLSMAYATKQAGVLGSVIANIKIAMEVYGQSLPEEDLVKESSRNVIYLVPSQELFPVKVAEDIPKAEEALIRNSKKLAAETIASASVTLVKEASRWGLNVSEVTLRNSGLMQCDRDKASEWIEARAMAAPDSSDAYLKLSSIVRQAGEDTPREDLTKLASALSELDRNSNIVRHYGKRLPNPQETIFNSKTAMGTAITLDGKSVPLEKLVRISPGIYGDILGEDIVEEISEGGEVDPSKVSEIFPTLPADMQRLLVKKLSL